jgi:predicted transcriptional regulator
MAETNLAATKADIAELDRQWAEIESGAISTVPHEKVARWLETWGTPAFKSWDGHGAKQFSVPRGEP